MLIKSADDKEKRLALLEDLLALPDFMKPKAIPAAERHAVPAAPVDIAPAQPAPPAPVVPAPNALPAQVVADDTIAKKLICAHWRAKISYPEGKFCWKNAKRFGGLQYCREHQGLFV